jgi:primary-amine oxidase
MVGARLDVCLPVEYNKEIKRCVTERGKQRPLPERDLFRLETDGLGFCANSLELGCDCVGNIFYFDALMNNSKGTARAGLKGSPI